MLSKFSLSGGRLSRVGGCDVCGGAGLGFGESSENVVGDRSSSCVLSAGADVSSGNG